MSRDEYKRAPHRGYFGVGVSLTAAMLVATFLAPALSILAPLIRQDLGLSRSEIGFAITLIFLIAIILLPLGGRLSDSLEARHVLVAVFGLGGVSCVIAGGGAGFGWLLSAAVLAGSATALVNPATNRSVAVLLPGRRQGVAIGMKQSGVPAASLIAGAVLPAASLQLGWRIVLQISGVLAVIGVGVVFRYMPLGEVRPVRAAPMSASALRRYLPGARKRIPYRDSGVSGVAIEWLVAYALLMGAGAAGILAYLPLYAVEVVGATPITAGAVAGLTGLVGIGARLIWGYTTDVAISIRTALMVLGFVAGISQALLLTAGGGYEWMLWLAGAGLGASAMAWNGVAMDAVVKGTSASNIGRASSRVVQSTFAGYVVAPVALGYMIDVSGSYYLGWTIAVALFFAATLIAAWETIYERVSHRTGM